MPKFNTKQLHWNYFLAIEEDLEKISRYIEFSEDNMKTYSTKLSHILLSAASEVDTIMKQICKIIDPESNAGNINDYKAIIKCHLPSLIDEEFTIGRYELAGKPWNDWNGSGNPIWWGNYNAVKHERDKYFIEANLENAINAVGALLITEVYYYQLAFSKESDNQVKFKDTTRNLIPEASFVRMKDEYYYHKLIV